MKHRHLTHEDLTLAAIDDIISRGRLGDWFDLRAACLENPATMAKIKRVCAPRLRDPYEQRYHFWNAYVEEHAS